MMPKTKRTFAMLLSVLVMGVGVIVARAADTTVGEKMEKKTDDVKAGAREMKRKAKKEYRDQTGQSSAWEDTKDKAANMKDNAADDIDHAAKKVTK